jgi:hypothetical protein
MECTLNIFTKAIDIINDVGWNKGTMVSPKGEICIIAAIGRASISPDVSITFQEYSHTMSAAQRQSLRDNGYSLAMFNDAKKTKKEDVIRYLERLAEIIE